MNFLKKIKAHQATAAAPSKETMDKFFDDATHDVASLWGKVTGNKMTTEDLEALNDVLTEFFTGLHLDY